jgi:hypothetical protein
MLIADFVPRVASYTPEAPDPLIEQSIREATREFLRLSHTWRGDLTVTLNGALTYEVVPPDGGVLFDLVCVEVAGKVLKPILDCTLPQQLRIRPSSRPTAYEHSGLNEVALIPPAPSGEVFIRAVFNISSTAESIPSRVVEEFDEAIQAGALRRLYGMRNRPWSDDQAAGESAAIFFAGVRTAKRRSDAGFARNTQETVAYAGL